MTAATRSETAAHAIIAVKLAFTKIREAIPTPNVAEDPTAADDLHAIIDLLEEGYVGMLVGVTQSANVLSDLRTTLEAAGIIASEEDEEQARTGGL